MNCFLMSFKPQFAEEILDGHKDCEVRTYLGAINEGDLLLVYESGPVMSITGYFTAGPSMAVKSHDLISALTRLCSKMPRDNEEFILKNYLKPSRKILIIKVMNPTKLSKPIPLNQLRGIGITIPRSYVRIDELICREIIMGKALNHRQ